MVCCALLHRTMPRDASVYPRARSPYFWCSFWCPVALRRRHVSTGFRVDDPQGRKKALRFAQERSEEARAGRGAEKSERWGLWVEAWLREAYREQPRTLQRYLGAWDWLRVFLDEAKIAGPRGLTYNDVIAFVRWREGRVRNNGRNISRNTALCDVRVLSLIMREAARRGFVAANPAAQLGLRRVPPREKPEMTAEEIRRIERALEKREGHLPWKERWMSVSFAIAIRQGCRLRETMVDLRDVDERRGTIAFRAKGRGGGVAHVFTTSLHPELRGLFARLREEGAVRACEVPVMGSKVWHDFFREIGLGHLCFHCSRVTVITRLAREGVPIQQAMRFVGHASEAVHRIYQRLQTDDLGDCLRAVGPMGRGRAWARSPGDARSI